LLILAMPLLGMDLTVAHCLAQADFSVALETPTTTCLLILANISVNWIQTELLALVTTSATAHSYKPEHSLRLAVLHSEGHGIKQGTTLSPDILLHSQGNMMRKY
jgi:hypothetical protein